MMNGTSSMNATPPLIRAYAGADAAVRALLISIVGEWRPLDGEAVARRGLA
jgi:hypothetical protein